MSRVWFDDWPRWRRYRARSSGGVPVPYNLWVNPSLTSAPDDLPLPAGLSIEEAVRIAEAITASHAESTRTMYRGPPSLSAFET